MMLLLFQYVRSNVGMGDAEPSVVWRARAYQRKSPVSRAVFIDEQAKRSNLPRRRIIEDARDDNVQACASRSRLPTDVINVICAAWLRHVSIAECQGARHHIIPADIVQATASGNSLLFRLRDERLADAHINEIYGFRARFGTALLPAFEIEIHAVPFRCRQFATPADT
jgi:hypothetical protein